jgi:hypothetical protein
MCFTHTARNELCVLRAEIDDKDGTISHARSLGRSSHMGRAPSARTRPERPSSPPAQR